MLTTRRKLSFGVATSLVLLGAVEVALRCVPGAPGDASRLPIGFVGIDPRSDVFPLVEDEELFWRLQPGAQIPGCADAMTADGYRGPRGLTPKPPGTKRVLCLGDSCVFGFGVEEDATFASRLGRWLPWATGTPWEVLNAGVPGYTTYQLDRWLTLHGAEYRPDVVVVYGGAWNEYGPALGCDDDTAAARVRSARAWHMALPIADLRLTRWIGSWMRPATGNDEAERQAKREKYIHLYSFEAIAPDGPRLTAEAFRRTLASLAGTSRSLGASVVFVAPGAPREIRQKFKAGDEYAQIVRDVAKTEGASLVEARRAMLDDGDPPLFLDNIHPSDLGHSLIAHAVAAELAKIPAVGVIRPDAVDAFEVEPVALHHRVEESRLEAGDVQVAAEALRGQPARPGLVVPLPSRLRYFSCRMPPKASLLASLNHPPYPAGQVTAEHVTFVVRVEEEGTGAPLLVERRDVSIGVWTDSPVRWLVDLAAVGERRVSLVFEVEGPPLWANWGPVELWSFRGAARRRRKVRAPAPRRDRPRPTRRTRARRRRAAARPA